MDQPPRNPAGVGFSAFWSRQHRLNAKGAIVNHTLAKTSLIFVIIAAGISCLLAEKRMIDRLADRADAVVVADVQSGRQSGYAIAFVLSVVRTIKGDLLPGATVNVSWGCTFTRQ